MRQDEQISSKGTHSSLFNLLPAGSALNRVGQKSWLMIYISLFSGLLAFFLLSTLLTELEFVDHKRLYQKLVKSIYEQAQTYKQTYQLDWLQIENTLNHGVRLTFNTESLEASQSEIVQFDLAQAKIHPEFLPYLLQVTGLLQQLNLNDEHPERQKLTSRLQKSDRALTMQIRVVGHTDAQPMMANARFKDNVELSSFRAFAVMRYLQTHSLLPREQFAIAGYGAFKPLVSDPNAAENRRIEVYIVPVIKPVTKLADRPIVPSHDNSMATTFAEEDQ